MQSMLKGLMAVVLLLAAALSEAAGPLTIVQGPDPTSLDPTIDSNKTTVNVEFQIFDPLIYVTPDAKPNPWLVTTWKVVNPTTWRLTLRKDVKFHNGEPFNARAVAYTIDRYVRSKGESAFYLNFVQETKIVDDFTVDLVTKVPTPIVPVALGYVMALPPGAYEKAGEQNFGSQPVGTGPFTFVSWEKGVRIHLRANPAYWNGAPGVAEVAYRPGPEASTRVALLETGEADIIANVPPEMIERIKRVPTTEIRWIPSIRMMFLELNVSKPPLSDRRVRIAMNHAIDKDSLIKNVIGGYGERRLGVVPPGWLGTNPAGSLTAYDYDPAKAKQLLAEAGYPSGFTVDYYYPIGRYLKDKEVAEAIAGMLERVGIKTTRQGSDIATLVTRIHSQTLPGFHFFSWAPLVFDTGSLWQAHFHSKAQKQYSWTPVSDKMVDEGFATFDPKQRQEIYARLEQYLVNEHVPWVFLYAQGLIYGTSKSHDWQPRPDELIDLRRVTRKP